MTAPFFQLLHVSCSIWNSHFSSCERTNTEILDTLAISYLLSGPYSPITELCPVSLQPRCSCTAVRATAAPPRWSLPTWCCGRTWTWNPRSAPCGRSGRSAPTTASWGSSASSTSAWWRRASSSPKTQRCRIFFFKFLKPLEDALETQIATIKQKRDRIPACLVKVSFLSSVTVFRDGTKLCHIVAIKRCF